MLQPKEVIENVEGHIKQDDLFATLATVIELVRQDIEKVSDGNFEVGRNGKSTRNEDLEMLKSTSDKLMYLQNNYNLEKKDEK